MWLTWDSSLTLGRLLNKFKIDIYWGTPQQFVTELHSRWQAYLEQNDDW